MANERVYKIVVDLSTRGSFAAGGAGSVSALSTGVDSLNAKVGSLGNSVADFGARAANAFTGAVEAAASVAAGFAKIGAAAGIGLAVYGVAKLNMELESTKVGLAGIFAANGLAADIPDGLKQSGGILAQMRKDAAALPGESEDLIRIFRLAANPAFKNGMDAQGLEAMSANAMAAGASFGMDQHQVAREFAMLQQGRAGAHNVFGTQLGIHAEEFNGLSGAERVKVITAELAKWQPTIAAFQSTMDAQWGSLKDNAKSFMREATGPLFEHVKGSMVRVNDWFTNNQTIVENWSRSIGVKLAAAWDWGMAKALEWGPVILHFATDFEHRLVGAWAKIEPVVANVAGMLKGSMESGAMLDRIETILKLYAIVKVGSMAGGAMSMFGGMGGVGAMGAAAGGMGVAAGVAGATALVGGGLIVGGQMSAMADPNSMFHNQAMAGSAKLDTALSNLSDTASIELAPAFESLKTVIEGYAVSWVDAIATDVQAIDAVVGSLSSFQNAIDSAAAGLLSLAGIKPKMGDDPALEVEHTARAPSMAYLAKGVSEAVAAKAKPVGGGGGTHIQKVEIMVHGADDPSRVARMVVGELEKETRSPRRGGRGRGR